MPDRWIKLEIVGLLREGADLNVRELPASLGLERVELVTVVELEAVELEEDG